MKFVNLQLFSNITKSISLDQLIAPKHNRLINKPYPGLSESALKYGRLFLAITETIMWAYTIMDYGLDYIFFYSNWGNTLTMIVFWLLLSSHYFKLSPYQHEVIGTIFEVALTMEYVINPLYWSLIYEPELFDPSKLVSYRGPYMNHFVPWIYLNIEWWLNGFQFNLPGTLHVFFFEALVYTTVNYIGIQVMGHPIYYFLTFNDFKTVVIFFAIVVMQIMIYFCITVINNYYKNEKVALKKKRASPRKAIRRLKH